MAMQRRAVTGLFPAAQAGKEPGAHRLASRHVNGAQTHTGPCVHGQPGLLSLRTPGQCSGEELGHACPGSMFQLYRIPRKGRTAVVEAEFGDGCGWGTGGRRLAEWPEWGVGGGLLLEVPETRLCQDDGSWQSPLKAGFQSGASRIVIICASSG